MKRLLILAFFAFPLTVVAQSDPHARAPSPILQMDNLPDAGELFIQYCLFGVCVERSTSCHGQCCSQEEADDEGYGCSGDVYGGKPLGFSYVGWRCELSGEPTTNFPLKGKAGRAPAASRECHNLR